MTPKGFLYKCTTKSAASAKAFLETHREYLCSHTELKDVIIPIFNKMDCQELLPTPALEQIRVAVFECMISIEANKLSQEVKKITSSKTSSKKFSSCIRNANGQIVENKDGEMICEFDLPQRAKDWCDRKLAELNGAYWGEVLHGELHDSILSREDAILRHKASSRFEYISKEDAMARRFKNPGMAFHKMTRPSSSKLGFGVKANPTVAKFSRG